MQLQIDHASPVPLHVQVENLLRQLIEMPQYKAGEFLPREIELAKQLGISRNTIRQATNKLEYEGLISRKKGQGTRVAVRMFTTRLDNWHSFTHEMNDSGIAFTNYLIQASLEEIDDKLATFFNLPVKSRLVKLVRLRGDADGPFVLFESYFHPRTGIRPDEDFSQPLYELLESRYNTPVRLSREQIRARRATASLAKQLRIKTGDPVLIRERFVYDAGERPVEYNTGFYNAEKFTYSIEIKR